MNGTWTAPGKCPVCGEKMDVVELRCPNCETSLAGHFQTCKFCNLTNEQKSFIEIFIKSRGNIKEVERELGISYPTVRGRLEAVIEALGYRVEPSREEVETSSKRREILDALSRGELTSEEAVKRLKQLG